MFMMEAAAKNTDNLDKAVLLQITKTCSSSQWRFSRIVRAMTVFNVIGKLTRFPSFSGDGKNDVVPAAMVYQS